MLLTWNFIQTQIFRMLWLHDLVTALCAIGIIFIGYLFHVVA